MKMEVLIALSFSILIAATIAIVKFRKINGIYFPFVYLVWIGAFNEILSYILYRNQKPNIINSNIYSLIESLLLMWLFINIGVFKRLKSLPYILITIFGIAWIIDNFVISRFGKEFNSYFIIIYSFPVVLLSINAINDLLIKEKGILKHPTFLICIGLTVFFIYRILVEVFWLYGLQASEDFNNKVYDILAIINLICNLIYALAILWMQKKQAFTLQF